MKLIDIKKESDFKILKKGDICLFKIGNELFLREVSNIKYNNPINFDLSISFKKGIENKKDLFFDFIFNRNEEIIACFLDKENVDFISIGKVII